MDAANINNDSVSMPMESTWNAVIIVFVSSSLLFHLPVEIRVDNNNNNNK